VISQVNYDELGKENEDDGDQFSVKANAIQYIK